MTAVFTPAMVEARVFEDGVEYDDEDISGLNAHVCGQLASISLLHKDCKLGRLINH